MFKFELISPEEKLISEDVTMVTIPGEEGEFGVLEGHSPLLSAVKMGVVTINKTSINDNPRRVFVAGGFADVGADHCTLLAEEAIDVTNSDIRVAEAEFSALEGRLLATVDEFEKQRLIKRVAISKAKVDAMRSI